MSSPAHKRQKLQRMSFAQKVDDVRIDDISPLISPALLLEELPITETVSDMVRNSRKAVENIIKGKDYRMLVVVGPCSIHDTKACKEYALKLRQLAQKHA